MSLVDPPNVDGMKSEGDIDGLIDATRYQKDHSMRSNAIKALGELGDTRAVESLVLALRDEYWEVCMSAADALDKLGWHPDDGRDGAWYWLAKNNWDKCVSAGNDAVEPLIFALKMRRFYHYAGPDLAWINGDWRATVAQTLGKIGDIRAVLPLIESLKLRDPNNANSAERAAEALGNIGDQRAIEPLTSLLLGKIGDQGIRFPRVAAARALGKIGHDSEVEPLLTVINLKSTEKYIRKAAAEALLALSREGRLDEKSIQEVATCQARSDWPL